ncbi:spermine oxidase-like [Anthonomus grandis grandis]|uniref:spermine oxidase-like n=1 Tax=Anthonomus grandis grandis TaxID=2921223 RepID=UPI0021652FDA|nr:spermine oxidase-like [Anthonomus grandis grandis]
MAKNQAKILIIGAGASGIAAATKLYQNGFKNLVILEAENRIGGRVCSVEFGSSFVDLGATWVHGEKGNIVYEMVKDLNLVYPCQLPPGPGMSFFHIDGSQADKQLSDRLFEIAMAIKDDQEQSKKHGGNFAEYFHAEYKERIQKEFGPIPEPKIIQLATLVKNWFKKFMVLLNSAENWSQLSTTSHYAFKGYEGDQLISWGSKGYKTILDVMLQKIPDPSQTLPIEEMIELNKEVNKIIWNKEEVTVKCTDGSVYSADHMIMTVSVGVLKEMHKKAFVPGLPEQKVNSIEGIPLGTVNKILLQFPHKWWPDDVKDISFLWSEDERDELIKEFPHGPIVNGRSWLENLFSFIAIDSHPTVLLGWVNGPTAKLVELLPDDVIIEGTMYMLRKFAGKQYDIPEPNGILRSKWGSNPHFRGSYVHVNSEMERRKANAYDLSTPLMGENKDRPLILFAGEATHSCRFSTVDGAIETGYREANRIISFYSQ